IQAREAGDRDVKPSGRPRRGLVFLIYLVLGFATLHPSLYAYACSARDQEQCFLLLFANVRTPKDKLSGTSVAIKTLIIPSKWLYFCLLVVALTAWPDFSHLLLLDSTI